MNFRYGAASVKAISPFMTPDDDPQLALNPSAGSARGVPSRLRIGKRPAWSCVPIPFFRPLRGGGTRIPWGRESCPQSA